MTAPTFLNRDEAAARVRDVHGQRCSAQYLAKLASTGGGPVFHRGDGRALYLPEEIDIWARSRIKGPFRN